MILRALERKSHPRSFDGDTLLILAIKGIAKESDGEVERRFEHAVSEIDEYWYFE